MSDLSVEVRERLRAIESVEDDGAFTMSELRGAMGCGENRTYSILRALIQSGQAESLGRRARKNVIGETTMVPVYRLK